jgi:hypothetical protein
MREVHCYTNLLLVRRNNIGVITVTFKIDDLLDIQTDELVARVEIDQMLRCVFHHSDRSLAAPTPNDVIIMVLTDKKERGADACCSFHDVKALALPQMIETSNVKAPR